MCCSHNNLNEMTSMTIEQARCISECERNEMIAEALALAYDASTPIDKRAVINAIAATMHSIGDPLERIWIEDTNGRRLTYKLEQALALLGNRADFRYLWAIPRSERRNSKSRYLTTVAIDNIAASGATLFFALPRGLTTEFGPHLTLLKLLAKAGSIPQYGFGFAREYGSPDHFTVGYVHKSGVREMDQVDSVRLPPPKNDRRRNPAQNPGPYRDGLRPILDVFPLNVLSDLHLQQKLGDASFKEWILRNTGPESLLQIGPRCFAWFVPASRTAPVSAQLQKFGLTIPSGPQRPDPISNRLEVSQQSVRPHPARGTILPITMPGPGPSSHPTASATELEVRHGLRPQ